MARLTEREAWEALADQYGALKGAPPGYALASGLCEWLWCMRMDGVVWGEVYRVMARAIDREVKRTGDEGSYIQPKPDEPGGIAARVAFCRRMAGK